MSLRLSEKHGVNPAIPRCYLCGEDKNEVVLFGKLKGDVEAPRNPVIDQEPCTTCKGYMEMGIILISVRDEEGDNPYRTGGWCVVKEVALERIGIQPPELLNDILKMRSAFIPDQLWDMIGLPRGEV